MTIAGLSTWLILALASPTAGLAGAPPQCEPVEGIHHLQADDSKRFFVFGERHGTQEIPRLFGEAVCAMSARAPVLVGLEIGSSQQASIDRFMSSDGSPAAREALLANGHWRLNDGRASQAMLDLFQRLRSLKASGRDISVIAFMAPAPAPEDRERGTAEALIEGLEARPGALVMVLIGSIHAERDGLGGIRPAAAYLPDTQTVTLNYVPWDFCRGSFGCGDRGQETRYRIFTNAPPDWRWPRFDLWYAVGEPFTASPLARDGQEE